MWFILVPSIEILALSYWVMMVRIGDCDVGKAGRHESLKVKMVIHGRVDRVCYWYHAKVINSSSWFENDHHVMWRELKISAVLTSFCFKLRPGAFRFCHLVCGDWSTTTNVQGVEVHSLYQSPSRVNEIVKFRF